MDREEEFRDLFAEQYALVVQAVFFILQDQGQAEEIAQDAFMQLLRHWGKVRDYEQPAAWVRRVALRLAVKSAQRERRINQALSRTRPEPSVDVSTQVAQHSAVFAAIGRLTPKERAVVVLLYFEDRRRQRSCRLDCSETWPRPGCTARVNVWRADAGGDGRRRLRSRSVRRRVDAGPSVEPETALALARVETGVHRQRTRRNLVLATAAAVATVAGVVWAGGSLGWPIGQGDVQPVEQPVQEPIDLDGDWVLVEDADLHDVHGLSQIISVGGRLVAVGQYPTSIVTSTDGIEWTPADTPGDVEEARVIRGGPGLIVFGHSTTEDRPAVWTSPDGETWTPVEDPDGELGGPNTSISSIVAGGAGVRGGRLLPRQARSVDIPLTGSSGPLPRNSARPLAGSTPSCSTGLGSSPRATSRATAPPTRMTSNRGSCRPNGPRSTARRGPRSLMTRSVCSPTSSRWGRC